MTEETLAEPKPPRMANTHVFVLTFTLIIATFAAFLALDFVLARIERAESASHAEDAYADGTKLLSANRVGDAIDRFETAHTMERDSVRYTLALAEAILAHGRAQDAESALLPILETQGMNGDVNLAMARVLLREGRDDEAKSFYHRAIYGKWSADTARKRTMVRLELIDLLVKQQRKQELLAELLPLDDAVSSIDARKRLARLYLFAGSPQRSADTFRGILHRKPDDADALAGMAEAMKALREINLRP